MSDGRYRFAFADFIRDLNKRQIPFDVNQFEQENRRLWQVALTALITPLFIVFLVLFVEEIKSSNALFSHAMILGFAALALMAAFLFKAKIDQNRWPQKVDNMWPFWLDYLRSRLRSIWLLYLGTLCYAASLIIITYGRYEKHSSMIFPFFLVGFACIMLIYNSWHTSYLQAIRSCKENLEKAEGGNQER